MVFAMHSWYTYTIIIGARNQHTASGAYEFHIHRAYIIYGFNQLNISAFIKIFIWLEVMHVLLEALINSKQLVKVYFVKAVEVRIHQSFPLYGNLHEIFKDKIFVGASKTTKILVPEGFRLYSSYVYFADFCGVYVFIMPVHFYHVLHGCLSNSKLVTNQLTHFPDKFDYYYY